MPLAKVDSPKNSEELPEVIRVPAAAGQLKSKIRGGLDVWEYILIARELGWDEEATATYLRQPLSYVRAALVEYRRDPSEVDERFRRMDEIAAHPDQC